MSPPLACPGCGQPLPADAISGFCPRCLLEMIDDESHSSTRRASQADDQLLHMPLNATEIPRRLGDCELVEEIARGGMGVVFRARQLSLNRTIALKLVLGGQFASRQQVWRVRAEAEAAAGLRHPNIVAIYETGEHEGQHFYSMEFVDGRDLAETVRTEGPLPARRAAQYLRIIAEAIQFAYQHGVPHPDLKPSNVLIDTTDQPRVTDFGLAKRLNSDDPSSALPPQPTLTGQALGSPGLMPPEHAVARNSGPPADVYGLGAILYSLLTGRAPFQAETIEAVLPALQKSDPLAPRQLNPSVPHDLETICLKCQEKDPGRRYPSAQAVAEELGLFLDHRPIRARPIGPVSRAWRWCRRKPALATTLVALHFVIGLGMGGIVWQWRRAERRDGLCSGRPTTTGRHRRGRGEIVGDLEPA